jgi:hypothetical protein
MDEVLLEVSINDHRPSLNRPSLQRVVVWSGRDVVERKYAFGGVDEIETIGGASIQNRPHLPVSALRLKTPPQPALMGPGDAIP